MRRCAAVLLAFSISSVLLPRACAWENLLVDPGFERYRYDPALGHYVPEPDAAWREVLVGRSSVRFDASSWAAPEGMTSQQPLGFTPGATGFEGWGETQNSGQLRFEQDITDLRPLALARTFEAWVWLGGAGLDDDTTLECKEEEGGWDIYFYASSDPGSWTEQNALEYHHERFNFWGAPGSFVQVSGIGKVPSGAAGLRMRVWATTFGIGCPPEDHGTMVALDNAYLGPAGPNLLLNGDFEQDQSAAEFRFWNHPDTWWGYPGSIVPVDFDGHGDDNFDHGGYRPYYGWRWAYGYGAYFQGWVNNAFSFGQEVDVELPAGSHLALSYYWMMSTKQDQAYLDLLRPLAWVDLSVEYKDGDSILDSMIHRVDWPVPSNPSNRNVYDFNSRRAHNPTIHLWPPAGTNRIGVHVRVRLNCLPPAAELFNVSVDDFNLRVLESPDAPAAWLEVR